MKFKRASLYISRTKENTGVYEDLDSSCISPINMLNFDKFARYSHEQHHLERGSIWLRRLRDSLALLKFKAALTDAAPGGFQFYLESKRTLGGTHFESGSEIKAAVLHLLKVDHRNSLCAY